MNTDKTGNHLKFLNSRSSFEGYDYQLFICFICVLKMSWLYKKYLSMQDFSFCYCPDWYLSIWIKNLVCTSTWLSVACFRKVSIKSMLSPHHKFILPTPAQQPADSEAASWYTKSSLQNLRNPDVPCHLYQRTTLNFL